MSDPIAAAVDDLHDVLFLSQELTDVMADADALFLTLTSAGAAAAAIFLILTMVALGMTPSAAARPWYLLAGALGLAAATIAIVLLASRLRRLRKRVELDRRVLNAALCVLHEGLDIPEGYFGATKPLQTTHLQLRFARLGGIVPEALAQRHNPQRPVSTKPPAGLSV